MRHTVYNSSTLGEPQELEDHRHAARGWLRRGTTEPDPGVGREPPKGCQEYPTPSRGVYAPKKKPGRNRETFCCKHQQRRYPAKRGNTGNVGLRYQFPVPKIMMTKPPEGGKFYLKIPSQYASWGEI